MKLYRNSKIRFGQIVLLGAFIGLTTNANAQEFIIDNSQFNIVGSGASAGFSQSASIDGTGAITNIANVPIFSNFGIPSFGFSIKPISASADTYTFRIGVIIDNNSTSSRLEAKLDTLNLVVDGNNNITGAVPVQDLRILLRSNDGSIDVMADISNGTANGPVSISGSSISIDGEKLISRISSNSAIENLILTEFDKAASYTYTIALEPLGNSVQWGIDTDSGVGYSFAAFSNFDGSAFELNSSELSSFFNDAQRVTGTFNVLPSGSTTDTGSTTDPIEEASTSSTQATDSVNSTIANGGTPTQEELDAVVTASQTLNTNLANTSSATVTTSQLSTLGTAVQKLVATNALLSQTSSQNASVTSNTNAVLSSAATLLKGFSEKETLTAAEANAGLEIVKNLLTNAPGFFAGSNEDEKNLTSMSDLLAATFALGAKANPPVVFEAKNYTGAVTALTQLNEKKITESGVCGSQSLTGGLNVNAVVNPLLQTQLWWFGSPNPTPPPNVNIFQYTPLTLVSPFLKPLYGWYENIRFEPAVLGTTYKIGPCGTITVGFTGNLQNGDSNPMLLAATAPIEIEKDLDNYTVKAHIGGNTFVGSIFNLVLVPSNFINGTIPQPNGTVLWVQDGQAYNIGSSSADFAQFAAAVQDGGYEVSSRNDGAIDIQTGPNEKFSGVFAYDNIAGHEGACGVVSITPPTGGVTSPEYAFTATCADNGVTQRIVPYVSQSDFYTLGNFLQLTVTTDRDTGIINIADVGRFKPSFFSYTLTTADQAYLEANATEGFAFRSSDINEDGKLDVEVLHSSGVQVLYGL